MMFLSPLQPYSLYGMLDYLNNNTICCETKVSNTHACTPLNEQEATSKTIAWKKIILLKTFLIIMESKLLAQNYSQNYLHVH